MVDSETEPACWAWPVTDQYRRDAERWSEADAFQLWHDGLCAICGAGPGRRLVLDHDHQTGMERGYLCTSCNIVEGKGDSPRIAAYRERNPATILGYQAIYVNAFGVTPKERAAAIEKLTVDE